MLKIKQTDCKAQIIQISGLNLGILDLENKVAYVLDSDTFIEKVKLLDIWKASDITLAYTDLTQSLREQGFSINHYRTKSGKETRKVYDILERLHY